MTRRALALTLVPAALVFAGCGGGTGDPTASDGKGPIAVTASDTTCEVARAEAPAGTIEFTVVNKGTKVNEFYVFAEGDRIMGEVENIAPGLTRTFHVEVAEPGAYEAACKPGMVGRGIRSPFTVTGASAAPKSDDAKIQAATTSYARYVGSQADALLTRTTEFVDLVKARKVDEAKTLYPTARSYWERIEPVAESFGDLDPKIDGREDVVEEGMAFTGYHRLERDPWVSGLQPDLTPSPPTARRRDDDRDPGQEGRVQRPPARERLEGPARRDGHRQDHRGGGALQPHRSLGLRRELGRLQGRDRLAPPRARGARLRPRRVVRQARRGTGHPGRQARHRDGYQLYTELTPVEVRALSDALDAVAEDVSKVAGVVAAA